MKIEELIAKWDVQKAEDYEKFKRCFPETDDLLAIVLRGHLLAEEYIDRINRHCFHYPEYYDQAKFNFYRKLLIAKAQVFVPHFDRDTFFKPIEILNDLRNNMAHILESPRIEDKILNFLTAVECMYSKDSRIIESLGADCSIEKRTRAAICFILGQLNVLDIVVEFMEKSRVYGAGILDTSNKID